MAVPNWTWPASGSARASALVPYAAGMAVADWSAPQVWPYSLASGAFSPAVSFGAGPPGLCGAVADPSGGLYCLSYTGTLFHLTSGGASGAISGTVGSFASGQVYVGLASGSLSGACFAIAASGYFYATSGAASGIFGAPAWFAAVDSNFLYTLLPSLSGVGTWTFSGAHSGLITLPTALQSPMAILKGSTQLAVGGWQPAPSLSGAAAAALDPQSLTTMLAVGSGRALLWTAPSRFADAWSQSQALTGLANLAAVAWRPDGAQALAASLASGAVQVLGYSGGSVSLAQTLGVSGACSIAIAGNSVSALVCQSGQAQAMPLAYAGGTWATGAAVTGLAGIVAAAPNGPSGAFVACTAGLALLTMSGGAWAVQSTTALPFAPQVLAVDSFGQAYPAGASGTVALVSSGGALLASGTASLSGTITGIAVQQGRIVLAVPGQSEMSIMALSAPGVLSAQGTASLTLSGTVGLALSATTLFAMGSGATQTYGFSGAPFSLTQVMSGAVGLYSGGTWTTTPLGIGHVPSALAFDPSGNLQVATIQNTWWTLTSGGVVSASGIVPQASGQAQTVPLGTSALLASGTALYAATSIAGNLIQLK